jgi:DNA modification methylase/transcriptional regulator with XRE-family HTH domain
LRHDLGHLLGRGSIRLGRDHREAGVVSVVILRGDAASLPLPDASVDAVVTDPPYGLEFMGREWDTFRTGDGFRRSRNEADAGRENVFGRTSRTSPEYLTGKPSAARIRERVDGRTNPVEGKSVTRTPEAYVAGSAFQAWCETWAAECLRVLKPGGHLLAFGGTRTWHRLACAVEDAGFEIRESVADLTGIDGPGLLWMQGSGFPKSLDVSKAIDKRRDWSALPVFQAMIRDARAALGITQSEAARRTGIIAPGTSLGGGGFMWFETGMRTPTAGQYAALKLALNLDDSCDLAFEAAEREVLSEAVTSRQGGSWAEQVNSGMFQVGDRTVQVTAPATDDAARWFGWGTALKPAWEPIVVGRKPLAGTVAANVLEHGTGALNIDGCRVGEGGYDTPGDRGHENARSRQMDFGMTAGKAHDAGRWPPNVLLGEEAAAELDRQSGTLTSGANPARRSSDKFRDAYGEFPGQAECTVRRGADSGGASRFFPVFRYEAKAGAAERPRLPDGTAWPTVKPVPLMQWLVRLVTPPGGKVLDLFCGTGTTGEACTIEGFDAILLDRDPQALALTRVRLAKPVQPLMFSAPDPGERARALGVPKPPPVPEGQGSLFDGLEAS